MALPSNLRRARSVGRDRRRCARCCRQSVGFSRLAPARIPAHATRQHARRLARALAPSEDLISAVEFNGDGSYLATGDRGGRIVIFESSEMDGVSKGNEHVRATAARGAQLSHSRRRRGAPTRTQARATPRASARSRTSPPCRRPCAPALAQTRRPPRYPAGDSAAKRGAAASVEYRFYCEFQSHEPEFDYLKSLEIEERINRCVHAHAGSRRFARRLVARDARVRARGVWRRSRRAAVCSLTRLGHAAHRIAACACSCTCARSIRWCPGYAGSRFLLSTNDKTIKLWKVRSHSLALSIPHLPLPARVARLSCPPPLTASASLVAPPPNPPWTGPALICWPGPPALRRFTKKRSSSSAQ